MPRNGFLRSPTTSCPVCGLEEPGDGNDRSHGRYPVEHERPWNNETPVLFHVEHWGPWWEHEPETFYNVLRGTESDLSSPVYRARNSLLAWVISSSLPTPSRWQSNPRGFVSLNPVLGAVVLRVSP